MRTARRIALIVAASGAAAALVALVREARADQAATLPVALASLSLGLLLTAAGLMIARWKG